MKALHLILFVMLAGILAGAAKKPKLTVRFHVEAIGNAGGEFTVPVTFRNPPREGHVEAVAFASERNIIAVFPVANADGSLGCAFQLDQSGRLGLETISKDRRSASILVTMGTKTGSHQVIDLVIDKPIVDGIIYIPTGITPGEMQMLRELYPIMGQPRGKKKK